MEVEREIVNVFFQVLKQGDSVTPRPKFDDMTDDQIKVSGRSYSNPVSGIFATKTYRMAGQHHAFRPPSEGNSKGDGGEAE